MTQMREGQITPDLNTQDHFGEPVSLAALRGHKVLLSFYRYASCPLCNLRVHALIGHHARWQPQGLRMIGVFQSSATEIGQYVGRQDAPFPFVPDPSMVLYRRFGVETSWAGLFRAGLRLSTLADAFAKGFRHGRVNGPVHRVPADFLIDEAGRFVRCYYGKDLGDHLPVEEIEAFVTGPTQAIDLKWPRPEAGLLVHADPADYHRGQTDQ